MGLDWRETRMALPLRVAPRPAWARYSSSRMGAKTTPKTAFPFCRKPMETVNCGRPWL
jgi:hypothetical protein